MSHRAWTLKFLPRNPQTSQGPCPFCSPPLVWQQRIDHFMGLGGVVVVGVDLTFKDGGKKSSENGRREDQAPLAGGEAGGCLEEEGAYACCSCCCCGVTCSSFCSTFSSPICCLKFPSRSVCDLRPFILPVLLRRSAQGTLVPPRLGLLTSQPSGTVPGRW